MKEKDVTSADLRNNQKRNKPSVIVNEKLRKRKNAYKSECQKDDETKTERKE